MMRATLPLKEISSISRTVLPGFHLDLGLLVALVILLTMLILGFRMARPPDSVQMIAALNRKRLKTPNEGSKLQFHLR